MSSSHDLERHFGTAIYQGDVHALALLLDEDYFRHTKGGTAARRSANTDGLLNPSYG